MKKNVLVVGLNKSGTSILTYRIAAGLKTEKIYFEPKSNEGLNNLTIHKNFILSDHSVTKCLWNPYQFNRVYDIGKLYTKNIWIIRDPRDVLISSFFYYWYHGHNPDKMQFQKYIALVKKKESNPQSISWMEMTKGRNNPLHYLKTVYIPLINTINILEKLGWFILKYEDFISGKIDPLNKYLGFQVDKSAEVHKRVERVKRSEKHENWRDYFTDEDVKLLKSEFNPILSELHYNQLDWNLNYPYSLDPSLGSDYMLQINHESK